MRRLRRDRAQAFFAELKKRGLSDEAAVRYIAQDWKIARDRVHAYLMRFPDGVESVEGPEFPVDDDVDYVWEALKERSRERILAAMAQGKATIRLSPHGLFVGITFISDNHIGSPFTDYERMEREALIIASTPRLYAVLDGDIINNYIFSKMAHASRVDAVSDVDMQYQLAEKYISLFGDKLLAVVSGNHDLWTQKTAGVDLLKRIAQKHTLLYDPHEFQIRLVAPGTEYNLLVRHKAPYNSRINLTHTGKQLIRLGRYAQTPDIVVVAHHHDPAIELFVWGGHERIIVRTGSYKCTDDFARTHAFNRGGFMVPTVAINLNERQMIPIPSLESAAAFLRGINEEND